MAGAHGVFASTGSHLTAQKILGIWVPGTGSTQARAEG